MKSSASSWATTSNPAANSSKNTRSTYGNWTCSAIRHPARRHPAVVSALSRRVAKDTFMKMSDQEFERQFAAATKRGKLRERREPRAESVRVIASHSVEILLNNGCVVRLPLENFPE